ncbi:MAG TPA: hypothetical protein VIY47_15765 [Ignavibacteriaceae bacterium]
MAVSTPLAQFDLELNEQFAKEDSRCVKVCILNLKCILMFTFLLLAFVYITVKEIFDEKELITGLHSFLALVSNNSKLEGIIK